MDFFCTAGRGTETFVHNEISERFGENAIMINEKEGKVFFKIQESCVDVSNRIYSLTTVERVFVHVLSQENSPLKGRRELLTYIHTELNKQCLWEKTLEVLYKVTNINKYENLEQSERTLQTSKKVKVISNKRAKIDGTLNTGAVLDEQSGSQNEQIISLNKHSETGHADFNDSENITRRKATKSEEEASSQEQTSVQNNSVNSCNWKEIPSRCTTFRVSCKFTGSVKHKLSPQLTVKQMGVLISKLMGWKTDLRNPKLEICIHINDEAMVVGIPLSREPLSKRPYIKHHGLRSTICRIMVDLAEIKAGEIVMDPMCGKATILLEAAQTCKTAHYFGMDKDEKQIKAAQENMEYGQLQPFIQLINGNALNLPFSDNSMDKIITDAPFGQAHIIETDLFHFYSTFLAEAIRVLKPGGLMVLLTSTEIKNFLLANTALSENVLFPKKKKGDSKAGSETFEKPAQMNKLNTCDSPTHNLLANKHMSTTYIEQNNCQPSVHLPEPAIVKSELMLENESDIWRNRDLSSTKEHFTKVSSNNTSGTTDRSIITDKGNEKKCVERPCGPGRNKRELVTESYHTHALNLKPFLVLKQCNYVKLGSTDGYICVMHINKGK